MNPENRPLRRHPDRQLDTVLPFPDGLLWTLPGFEAALDQGFQISLPFNLLEQEECAVLKNDRIERCRFIGVVPEEKLEPVIEPAVLEKSQALHFNVFLRRKKTGT